MDIANENMKNHLGNNLNGFAVNIVSQNKVKAIK